MFHSLPITLKVKSRVFTVVRDISPVSFLVISVLGPCPPRTLDSYCSSNVPQGFVLSVLSPRPLFPSYFPACSLSEHPCLCHFLRETSPDTLVITFLSLCHPLPQCMFFKTFVTT